jgi:antitoxin PrlF
MVVLIIDELDIGGGFSNRNVTRRGVACSKVDLHYYFCGLWTEVLMASQAITAKGQITLKRELLQHLGVKPGQRIDFDKLPGGELRVRAARPTGTIDDFLGVLDGKVDLKKPLSIEDMSRIAAAGWAGELDQE